MYADYDEETGKPLGLMGIARKYSPDIVCNNRSGWMGEWLKIVGVSVYGTCGGPRHPRDYEYGFTMKDKKIFIHLLPAYRGTSFITKPLSCTFLSCKDLYTGKPLTFKQTKEGKVEIAGIDREAHSADTIIALILDKSPPKPEHINVPRSVIENKK